MCVTRETLLLPTETFLFRLRLNQPRHDTILVLLKKHNVIVVRPPSFTEFIWIGGFSSDTIRNNTT